VTGRRSNRLSYTPLRAFRRPEALSACTVSDSLSQGGHSARTSAPWTLGLHSPARLAASLQRLYRSAISGIFEFQSFVLIGKCRIPNQLPRNEFGRMDRFSRVVIRHPLLQVGSRTNVVTFWGAPAADYVNVPHELLHSVFAFASPSLRSSYAGPASA